MGKPSVVEGPVRYLEMGVGSPVVLLHGGGVGYSGDVWRGNIEGIAGYGLRVLAPDFPGYGGTDLGDDHSEAGTRNFLLSWLAELEIDRVGFVGHSHNGRVAAQLALEQPDRISGLVIVGTGSMLPLVEGGREPVRTRPAVQPPPGTEPTREHVRAAMASDLYDPSQITPEALDIRYEMSTGARFKTRLERESAPKGRVKGKEPPIYLGLNDAPFPVLMVFGRQDQGETVQERIELLEQLCPNIKTCVMDRAKHLVQWDARERFNEVVGTFFQKQA